MTKRARNLSILGVVVGVVVAAEMAVNLMRGPEACVEVHNEGAEPIENLVVSWGSGRHAVGRVESGGSVRVFLPGRGARPLGLTFRQKGNAMGSYELPGFDPEQLSREGFKQVLRVRPNEVERYMDDVESHTPVGRLLRNARESLEKSTEPVTDP